METWDAITARRNVREFAERVIPDADLDRVLEAGRIAPSSQNNQPWDFVVVTDREMLRELSQVWRGGGHIANAAAAIAMVIPDEEEPRARERNRFDIGQATMQMMIAAADQGIGAGHSAVGDQDLARSVLHVPEEQARRVRDRSRLSGGPPAHARHTVEAAAVRRGCAPQRLVKPGPSRGNGQRLRRLLLTPFYLRVTRVMCVRVWVAPAGRVRWRRSRLGRWGRSAPGRRRR